MDRNPEKLDRLREGRSELENAVIDEYVGGHLSRRQFMQRGTAIGISIPAMAAIVSACGGANSSSSTPSSGVAPGQGGAAQAGSTLRVAGQVPTGAINPLTVEDEGGLTMLQQTGEFLVFNDPATNILKPQLATSWSPNTDGSVWTFKLRQGVKFSDGTPMTADDVVASFAAQSNPKSPGNAASAFSGVLDNKGIKKVDDQTIQFTLEAPNGNFPYLISSDNYNMIIVPKDTDYAKWQDTFIGTGPFKLQNYTVKVGANFVPNPNWWGGKALPAKLAHTFYQDQQAMILALQGNEVDIVNNIVPAGAEAVLNNSAYKLWVTKSSQHRELSMRTDQAPWNNKLVRQAMALSLNRPQIAEALFKGYAQVGNDSPFAPIFRSTDPSVPQRTQNIAKAKQLLSQAGHPSGFSTHLYTEDYQEIPQYAQIIKQAGQAIGIDIALTVADQGAYYDKYWLTGTMSLVDYGHRGVPNVFLQAPLLSNGAWNAAHFKDPTYDNLVKQYVAAIDPATQRTIAGKIQNLLLDETPLIIAYFFDALTVTKSAVRGVVNTGMGQIFLQNAGLSA